MTGPLQGKRVLVTGGTGSLGQVIVRRIVSGELGEPAKVVVFSRDEAKQHRMRVSYLEGVAATDEVIYSDFCRLVDFRIGDVRDGHSVAAALRDADVVVHAAALKQVPTCEYFPFEAVQTNIGGPENLVRAIREHGLPVETFVGVSTDKACKPVNVMGMTKALQERLLIRANIDCPQTRFVCVRYGNVLASRGSVIPFFIEQIARGGPVTVTTPEMTRFFLSLDRAVETVFAAIAEASPGDTYVPRVPSARVTDIAAALIGDRPVDVVFTGIRPGEKIHEILVSEEEAHRTVPRGDHFVILPILPELRPEVGDRVIESEYSSASDLMSVDSCRELLRRHGLTADSLLRREGDLLR